LKSKTVKTVRNIAGEKPETARNRARWHPGRAAASPPVVYLSRTGHALDLDSLPLPAGDPALLYLQTLAPGSRRSQWSAICRVARILSGGEVIDGVYHWHKLTPEDVIRLRLELIETLAPPTGRRYLGVLKAMIEFAYIQRQISDDMRARLIHPRNLYPIRGSSPPAGRALDPSEVTRFSSSCEADRMPAARRDAAVFGLMYLAGLRGREIISLDLGDLDLETGLLKIHGKGAKNREVVLSWDAQRLVWRWIVEVRGDTGGPLFTPLQRRGAVSNLRRISYRVLFTSLRRRAERSGLEPFTPHDLRRTFITDLLKGGKDLEVVAHLVGHSDVNTTARYRRGMAAAGARVSSLRNFPTPPKREGDDK